MFSQKPLRPTSSAASQDTVQLSTENIQPTVAQTQVPIDEPIVSPKPKLTTPYPSRANKQKLREKDDNLALKFVEIFRNLHFELSFIDALLHMPKFALMLKSLLNNKEKLFDLATTPVNENCSTIILKKLPEKLGDPAIVDYVVDPRIPLILGRPFLRTVRALINVYGEELTLHVDDEAITFKVGQTSKYSYNDVDSFNRIDVIDVACEDNTVPNPQEDLKAITTRSGVTLAGPSVSPPPPPSKEVDREPETITDQVLTESTNNVPTLVFQPSPASTSFTPIPM
uniref:Reverse transcriptase domain-containing protein n=1 Tax=Tanacetum cinerariifolium TaxID=118510 RepID=A0A699KEY7_TANCI|nr:reverse transcriptase domain-containing protein [Tanacetum cinerariifolium]